jgi:hypothetical protein
VRLGELGKLVRIAAHENRIGHDPIAVAQQHTAFGANGGNGTGKMLVAPHAPGHAMHHDAEPSHCHHLPPGSLPEGHLG